jgi:hypothetical protein
MLGGLVWWQEYGSLLKRTGHLSSILKAKCVDRMQFGDGPSHTALFVALQVPLWYRCTDGSSLLVFSNIRIVPNCVGLLDGMQNMAELGLTCKLATDSHAKFLRQGKEIAYADEGGHFYLLLDAPRGFEKNQNGVAVHRDHPNGLLMPHDVLANNYRPKALSVAPEYADVFRDDYPELVASSELDTDALQTSPVPKDRSSAEHHFSSPEAHTAIKHKTTTTLSTADEMGLVPGSPAEPPTGTTQAPDNRARI